MSGMKSKKKYVISAICAAVVLVLIICLYCLGSSDNLTGTIVNEETQSFICKYGDINFCEMSFDENGKNGTISIDEFKVDEYGNWNTYSDGTATNKAFPAEWPMTLQICDKKTGDAVCSVSVKYNANRENFAVSVNVKYQDVLYNDAFYITTDTASIEEFNLNDQSQEDSDPGIYDSDPGIYDPGVYDPGVHLYDPGISDADV